MLRIEFHYLYILLFAVLFFGSCSNRYIDEVDRGAGYEYKQGFPELRLAASGLYNEENEPIILVTGDVVYGSLIYSRANEYLQAVYNIDINITKSSNEEEALVHRVQFSDTLSRKESTVIHSQEVDRFIRRFKVEPGRYNIRVTLTDQSSRKQTVRESTTEIPDLNQDASHITEIRILGKNNSKSGAEFHSATTYDIPGHLDSLKFVFQINNTSEESLEVESRLIKFKADTSIARPMSFQNYSASSMPYIGIKYDEYDVVQSSKRTLTQIGNILIEYNFHELQKGNYRLEVTANKGNENEIYKARDFSIKNPYYPSLKKPRDLAEPLYYIMDNNEYEKLMSIKNSDSLKKAVDRFWLSNINNSQIARNVISLYYERVEEANKQFSNYKEGWKTDPGMVYILFGPPWSTDFFSDQMVWSYSYNLDDPEKNFLFKQPKLKNKFYPFYNFILQRSVYYHSLEYKQKERWLTGSILNNL